MSPALTRPGFELGRNVVLSGLYDRSESREQTGNESSETGEHQHARVRQRISPLDLRKQGRAHDGAAPLRDRNARGPANDCEENTFDNELHGQPYATHAERESNGNLAASLERAAEEKISDVRTCNEQHDARDAEEQGGDVRVGRSRWSALLEDRGDHGLWLNDLQ